MPDFFHATKNQLRSQQAGADTIVYLAASEEALKYESGDFFFDRSPAAKHLWLSGTQYDDAKVDVLMKKMRSMVEDKGFRFPT